MAKNVVVRWIRALFDAPAAKKVEAQLEGSLASAGKKGGAGLVRELKAALDKRMAELKVALAKNAISPAEFRKQADLAGKAFNQGLLKHMTDARKAGTLTDGEYLKLSRTLKRVGDDGAGAAGRIGGAFLKVGATIAGFFAFSRIKALVADSIGAAVEAENSTGRLDVALQNIGHTYSQVSEEVEGYLDDLMKTTRFNDEDAREALVNLVTITGDYRKSLSLLSLVSDVASKRNTTMAASAQAVGDASKGITRGLKDLGISTKDTGDLVAKLRENLGGFATREGKSAGGQMATLRNLLGEVKESFGFAILSGTGFTGTVGTLRDTLIDLNRWIKANSDSIGEFVSSTASALSFLGKGLGALNALRTGSVGFGSALSGQDALVAGERKRLEAADKELEEARAKAQATWTRLYAKGTADRGVITDEEKRLRLAREQELATELDRINTELSVRRLQIEQGLTEALAREMVRRQQLLAGGPKGTSATVGEVAAGHKKLDESGSLLAAGFDKPLMPKLSRTENPFAELQKVSEKFAKAQPALAKKFETPWTKALGLIENEVEGQGTLFAELGQAWADGGIKGLAALAAAKVKENLAQAIEWTAKAIGLSIFNPGMAGPAWVTAATHSAAAGAWALVGGVAGGGGSSASSPGGLGTSGGQGVERAESMEAAQAETHIYFMGPKAFSPEMEKIITGNLQANNEKVGPNAKVHYHYGNGKGKGN